MHYGQKYIYNPFEWHSSYLFASSRGAHIRIACDTAYIQVDVKLIIAIVHSCKLKL